MVIWLLLGCKRDVHLFSLRISATSVQSCTSICGTGPQCTQCLDWDKWRESRKGPLGGGLKDYSFSPRSLGKWANLTSNFLIVWNHQLWCNKVSSHPRSDSFPRTFFLSIMVQWYLTCIWVLGGNQNRAFPRWFWTNQRWQLPQARVTIHARRSHHLISSFLTFGETFNKE